MMTFEEMRKCVEDYGLATKDEVSLVCMINGYEKDSIDGIVYARTGYETIEDWLREEVI